MALRNLVTKGEQHGKRILDFESATEEEVIREARLLDKQINKNLSHIREYNENVMPRVLQGIYGKVKWFFGAGAVVELHSHVSTVKYYYSFFMAFLAPLWEGWNIYRIEFLLPDEQ
ncbi:hypothetical protein TRIUR3_35340 [Triticum urartu]|uniref:Uncharacterized protein n=1 Tax=Triticum urartu TaxID=4572 RepID=M7ZS58_TRIUA|nr:hypothetical protein TRIUR3_35340 [Triticum urartu]